MRCAGHRLPTLQAGFKHAALVAYTSFGTVFIGQMHLDPCDFVFEITQSVFDRGTHLFGHARIAWGAVVGVDLNLHGPAFER
jgi:hypothetical protein